MNEEQMRRALKAFGEIYGPGGSEFLANWEPFLKGYKAGLKAAQPKPTVPVAFDEKEQAK